MINATIYDTATLLGVIRDNDAMQPPSNYWLTLGFGSQINFTDEYVDFAKLGSNRKIAPLVVPTVQGKPIYSAAERQVRVKPAYLKPKDPISASRMIKRHAGSGNLNVQVNQSPAERYNAIVADIQREHRRAIERRWEWMASEAIQDGAIVLEDEAYPRTVVDFGRAPNHTVALAGAAKWGQAGVSILGDLETWRSRVRTSPFGGPTNRLTIGTAVWEVMKQDAEILELMKQDLRQYNNGINLNLGLSGANGGQEQNFERVGSLGGNLEVYVYYDYYQEANGTIVPFMSENDVVLTGPNINGIRCFGAIQDIGANFQALDIFPKMWSEQDPSATFIMNQSAPLMVPVNPNSTLKATVL